MFSMPEKGQFVARKYEKETLLRVNKPKNT